MKVMALVLTVDKGYIVNTPAGGMVKFTGDAWDNQPEPAPNTC